MSPPNRRSPRLTHFLSLPLTTAAARPSLTASLARLKADLSAPPALLCDSTAVRPPGTLHLTIGVMSLSGAGRLAAASALLRGLDLPAMLARALTATQHSPGSARASLDSPPPPQTDAKADGTVAPLTLTLTSLASMHDPKCTSILYAIPHDRTERLQRFTEALRDAFAGAGLMVAEDRPLRLHATVVNTVYARSRSGRYGKRYQRGFDARALVESWQARDWMGEVKVERVAICRMGATVVKDDLGKEVDAMYEEVVAVDMP